MTDDIPQITIAIPTYNSAANIQHLIEYACSLHPYRIYVLDDASTDNTVQICRQFPAVEVITGETNLGPTRNRNRILGKDIGDILIFLDDDMRWQTGDIVESVRKQFANPKVGAIGFAIFDTSGKEIWFGNEHESNPLFFWARIPPPKPLKPKDRQRSFLRVQWLLEGAFAVRSKLFNSLDGFDERFKRNQEGPDLCRRIRQRKYLIGYTHDVQFEHTKPLSVFRLSHAGRYLRSGIIWHAIHRGKVKE